MADPILAQERFVPNNIGPAELAGENNAHFFDGRNMWICNGSNCYIIEFWGPYNDLDNSRNTRWDEHEVDIVTLPEMGPKVMLENSIIAGLFFSPTGNVYFGDDEIPETDTAEFNYAQISHVVDNNNSVILKVKFRSDSNETFSKLIYDKSTYRLIDFELSRFMQIELGRLVLPEQVPDENGVLYTPESEIVRGGDYWWCVGPVVRGQYGDDRQYLYRYTQSVAIGAPLVYHSHVAIPGRKQFDLRALSPAYGKMWVTGFNTSSIHGYDLVTGAFFTSVGINRDVKGIHTENGLLYTLSRNGLVHNVSEALNVTPVGNQSYWDDIIGKKALPKRKWCDLGSVYWRVSKDKMSIEKVDKATNLVTVYKIFDKPNTIIAVTDLGLDSTVFSADDDVVPSSTKTIQISESDSRVTLTSTVQISNIGDNAQVLSIAPTTSTSGYGTTDLVSNLSSSAELPKFGAPIISKSATTDEDGATLVFSESLPKPEFKKKVTSVCASPVMTYEYFDGTTFQTVEVPEHVMVGYFDGTDYKTETFRLPGFYRGIAKKTASGYTAVSIGPLSYKGDNC